MAQPVLLAVDGNSLVHRSFHAQASSEQPFWAVRGLLTQLVAAVDRVRPSAVVVGFDDAVRSARRERWPGYKANRVEKLESLVAQLVVAAHALRDLGVAVVIPPGLEADDVLASAAQFGRSAGARTVIVTSDRDAFALIDETTDVLRIINGGVEASPLMTCARLFTLLGVHPHQYRDFAALRGDPSDNLPGVRGIGPHHAARLLAEFGSARAAFDALEEVRSTLGPGIADRLAHPDARPAWELNCQVMTMHVDVPLGVDLSDGPGVLPLDPGAVASVFGAHNLSWTAARAVGVLADADYEPPAARPSLPTWVQRWSGPRPAQPPAVGARGGSRLMPRRPAAEQLSLFD